MVEKDSLPINEGETGTLEHIQKIRDNDLTISIVKIKFKTSNFFHNLANVLKLNTSIVHLDLSHNFIDQNHATEIASIVSINTSIHTLDLSHCEVKDKHIQCILESLTTNTSIRTLKLPAIFGDDGKRAVSKFLYHHENPMLTFLLRHLLGNEAATAIASELIPMNITLQELQFHNNFGDIQILANALGNNGSLQKLRVYISTCTTQNANALVHVLETNTVLKNLDLSWGYVDRDGYTIISEALRNHSILHILPN